jgi:hypothetical protein
MPQPSLFQQIDHTSDTSQTPPVTRYAIIFPVSYYLFAFCPKQFILNIMFRNNSTERHQNVFFNIVY